MKTKDLKNAIIEELENDESKAIECYNKFAEINSYETIFGMYELDDVVTGTTTEVLDSVMTGFNTNHNYFYCDGRGYWRSFDYIEDSDICLSELADYILENMEDFDDIEALEDEDED